MLAELWGRLCTKSQGLHADGSIRMAKRAGNFGTPIKNREKNPDMWRSVAPDGAPRPTRDNAQRWKPKDLMLMPARVAIALQEDGWWVRSEIIWHKPNPMPESVRDRPTSAHEKLFLLSRSRAKYFYDADAVRVPGKRAWHGGG